MKYVKLGRTGLDVSRICLGCMSYGAADSGNHAWSLAEAESRPFIKRALEGGVNFFDTANRYSLGSSEEILGRAIKDFARRDEVGFPFAAALVQPFRRAIEASSTIAATARQRCCSGSSS